MISENCEKKVTHNQKVSERKGFGLNVKTVHVINENTILCIWKFMRLPCFSTAAYTFGDSHVPGAEAISQSWPCMMSYFKGGVESWRVARPGRGSGWGLGLVPQAPRSSGHTASAPGLSPDIDLWDRGITIKPAVRTTQMVAQDDSGTNTHMHMHAFRYTYAFKHTLICASFFFTQISN